MKKPSNLTEYKQFLEKIVGIDMRRLEEYYDDVSLKMKEDFEENQFLKTLRTKLIEWDDIYLRDFEYTLIEFGKSLKIDARSRKCFNSMLIKSYRIDINNNEEWDKHDVDDDDWINKYEWITPLNCYERINDIVRTRIIVRFLHGAIWIISNIEDEMNKYVLKCCPDYVSEESGYYGIHIDIPCNFIIKNIDIGSRTINTCVELQISTEIKDVINELLHKYYEEHRLLETPFKEDWQWDYESKEFATNYLGHVGHYIEGMIMSARQKLL